MVKGPRVSASNSGHRGPLAFASPPGSAACDLVPTRSSWRAELAQSLDPGTFERALDHWPDHARMIIEAWRRDCSAHRYHSSLGELAPTEFARRPQDQLTVTKC